MPGDGWTVDGKSVAEASGVGGGGGAGGDSGWTVDGKPVAGKGKPPGGVSGFIQGAVDMLNPVPLLRSMKQSQEQHPYNPYGMFIEPAKGIAQSHIETGKKFVESAKDADLPHMIGYGLGTVLPVMGPAAVSAGENIREGNTAYGVGQAAGMLAPFGVTTGIAKYAPKAAPVTEASAQSSFSKALRPTGMRARMLAEKVVSPEAVKRGITAGSLDSLADQASAGKARAANAIETGEQAIIDRQNAAMVQSRLTGNPPSTPVQLHPVQPLIDFLEDLRQGKGKSQGPTQVNGQIVNPVKDAAITKYQNILREMANNDEFGKTYGGTSTTYQPNPLGGRIAQTVQNPNAISEGALLEFRRGLDELIQGKHTTIPGSDTPAPLSVTKPLSNTLRAEFNQTHPDIAQAFKDYRFFKTFENLANRAQVGRTGLSGWTETMGTLGLGIGDFLRSHNPIEAAATSAAFSALYRLSRSTAWRTLSSATKHNLANAMANGQFTLVNSILQKAQSGAGMAGSDLAGSSPENK